MKNPAAKQLLALDQSLFESVSQINILDAITPLDYRQQKASFFQSNYSQSPVFTYAKRDIDLFAKKRALYNLPVDKLVDDDLQQLYTDVVESYVDKLDQYKSIGTSDFFYDSLRYFGEPSKKDLRNAHFILHLPEPEAKPETLLNAEQIVAVLTDFGNQQGYAYKLSIEANMIANILVSGITVKINQAALLPKKEVEALLHHEMGVHLVTTLNGQKQPLKVLSLGCPLNTTTQEGIAILCEFLSGCLTLPRLKVLALRVLAVHSMINERDFKKTYLLLKEQYHTSEELAFTITARVYRGGGFTKDYLYLRGLHEMLNAYESRDDFNNLLCGKTSIDYLDIITRLVAKNQLLPPSFISPAITAPKKLDAVQKYIAHAIK